jgi:hypothetical protein
MVERGAQPDMLRWPVPEPALKTYIEALQDRGARPLPAPIEMPAPPVGSDSDGRESPVEVCWRAGEGGSAVLRQLDLLAGQILPANDTERQNWIARAPRYLPRALRLERSVAMNDRERSAFMAAVEERAQQGALATRVEIDVRGQVRSFAT